MFTLAVYKVNKQQRRHWLSVWPFGASDLQRLMRNSPITEDKSIYVNIQHQAWEETRHLPHASELGARPLVQGAIGILPTPCGLWQGNCLDNVIDLELYIPDQPIERESDTAIIYDSCMSGAYENVLARWGGYGIFLHDRTRLNVDYDPSSHGIRQLFAAMLHTDRLKNSPTPPPAISLLWDRLNRLAPEQCAVIASNPDGGFLLKATDKSILQFEETNTLFPEDQWQYVATGTF